MATLSMIHMTEGALRAMSNLNASGEANWMEIKQYLRETKETLKSMAAFAVDVPAEKRQFFTGLAWALNDLSIFADDPKTAILKIQNAKERTEKKVESPGS